VSGWREGFPRVPPRASDSCVEGTEALTTGDLLDDRFRIVRRLGRGGTGEVYEAVQISLARRVAVKVLLRTRRLSRDSMARFEREARAMAQVRHPNVASVFDFGVTESGIAYLVMEHLEGCDLRQLIADHGELASPRAVRLMREACQGLASAHRRGIVHRDLKPENLFIARTEEGLEKCVVLDFGLAKFCSETHGYLKTVAGMAFGTLSYMSPEQARGDENIDERSDVYGCAAVLYELLCGRRPHVADSSHALLYRINHEPPIRLEQTGAFLPPGLADVVHRALNVDPAERPESIAALSELLEPFESWGEMGRSQEAIAPTSGAREDTYVDFAARTDSAPHLLVSAVAKRGELFALSHRYRRLWLLLCFASFSLGYEARGVHAKNRFVATARLDSVFLAASPVRDRLTDALEKNEVIASPRKEKFCPQLSCAALSEGPKRPQPMKKKMPFGAAIFDRRNPYAVSERSTSE